MERKEKQALYPRSERRGFTAQLVKRRRVARVSRGMILRAWFVGNRLSGNEISVKTARVGIQQLFDSFVALGLQNETRMMILRDAINDFGVCICGSIRMLLASQRKNRAGVVSTRRRELVRLISGCNFKPRPLAPEIDARCALNDV